MSRIGKRKLTLPAGVTLTQDKDTITITGPKGTLSTPTAKDITVTVEGNIVSVDRANEMIPTKAMHGTMNANINNMITGVTHGFEKALEIIGVGYRFALKGKTLVINAGYSNPVEMSIPEGIEVESPSNTELTLKSIDKIKLGEFAANVRKVRPPEPYKGKGIRYKDEHVRRKEGKKAA